MAILDFVATTNFDFFATMLLFSCSLDNNGFGAKRGAELAKVLPECKNLASLRCAANIDAARV